MLIAMTVLPPSHVQRPTYSCADTRRQVRRRQNEGGKRGRRFHCGGTWCLGYITCAWNRVGAFGTYTGEAYECEDRGAAAACVDNRHRLQSSFWRYFDRVGLLK